MEAAKVKPAEQPSRTARRGAAERIAEVVSYWVVLGSVYVLQGSLWYYSFKEKIFDDDAKAPLPIQKQFDGTVVDSVLGTSTAWALLGILEGLAFLAIVVSLLSGEFLPHRRKPVLFVGLGLAMLTFAVLLFGETLTKQFDSVANLYAYFGATAVLVILLLLMPPYRPTNWLSSLFERG
jgi:CBS domain containing-hemolysin-like protein